MTAIFKTVKLPYLGTVSTDRHNEIWRGHAHCFSELCEAVSYAEE